MIRHMSPNTSGNIKKRSRDAATLSLAVLALAACGGKIGAKPASPNGSPNTPTETQPGDTITPPQTTPNNGSPNYTEADKEFFLAGINPDPPAYPGKGTYLEQVDAYIGTKVTLENLRRGGMLDANTDTLNHAIEVGLIQLINDNGNVVNPDDSPRSFTALFFRQNPNGLMK